MAIAVDATVARFTGSSSATSASFTPPNGSLLVCCTNANTSSGVGLDVTLSGGSLTWTQRKEADNTLFGNSGHASIWTAPVVTGASMTVTVTSTGGNSRTSGKVYIVTGHDVASPVGSSGAGTSTANAINVGYTSSVNASRGIGCATDWNARGVPTSTDTEDGATNAQISEVSAFKAADTATSGTAVTINFDGFGTSGCEWQWCVIEIKPAAGGDLTLVVGRGGATATGRNAQVASSVASGRGSATAQGRAAAVTHTVVLGRALAVGEGRTVTVAASSTVAVERGQATAHGRDTAISADSTAVVGRAQATGTGRSVGIALLVVTGRGQATGVGRNVAVLITAVAGRGQATAFGRDTATVSTSTVAVGRGQATASGRDVGAVSGVFSSIGRAQATASGRAVLVAADSTAIVLRGQATASGRVLLTGLSSVALVGRGQAIAMGRNVVLPGIDPVLVMTLSENAGSSSIQESGRLLVGLVEGGDQSSIG